MQGTTDSASSKKPAGQAGRSLLLGLGNDILTDDAIGWRVVEAVRGRLSGRGDVTIQKTAEMGLALMDLMVGFNRVLLVDAVQTATQPPGYIHELDGTSLPLVQSLSPHFLGVGEALALGRQLGLLMPEQVRIFAIEVRDPHTVGTVMTPELETALPGIAARIAAAV